MEEMRERKDTFEMPEIPNVAIPELREGAVNGVSNGVSGVTMREGGGRVKRGSIKRQSEILRQKNILGKNILNKNICLGIRGRADRRSVRRSGNEKRATSEKLQVGRYCVCFFTQPLLVF